MILNCFQSNAWKTISIYLFFFSYDAHSDEIGLIYCWTYVFWRTDFLFFHYFNSNFILICFILMNGMKINIQANHSTAHKKWSFPLRISSVNVTKSAVSSIRVKYLRYIFHIQKSLCTEVHSLLIFVRHCTKNEVFH